MDCDIKPVRERLQAELDTAKEFVRKLQSVVDGLADLSPGKRDAVSEGRKIPGACDFCGMLPEPRIFVKNPQQTATICDECVGVCLESIGDQRLKNSGSVRSTERAEQPQPPQPSEALRYPGCEHIRLTEEGYCRTCGADRRGIH